MNDYENQVWYCVLNGTRIGPMPWQTLRERARRGELRRDDLVWAPPFQTTWRRAGSVEGLFDEATEPGARPTVPPAPAPGRGFEPLEGEEELPRPTEPRCRQAFRRVWQRMVYTLFRPFDLARWFSIAFCVWLAWLGATPNLQRLVDVKEYQAQIRAGAAPLRTLATMMFDNLLNTPWLSPGMLMVITISALTSVLLYWLRARGSLMFLYRIHHPHATIRQVWNAVESAVLPLFWWRLAIDIIGGFAFTAISLGSAFSLGLGLFRSGNLNGCIGAITLPWALTWGGSMVFLFLVWIAIKSLSFHFMEPYLYRDRQGVPAAWRRVWTLCRDYPLAILRFYVLLVLFLLTAGLALMGFALFTCCLGLLLLVIPIVGAVIMLPLYWMHRGFGAALIDFEE